LSLSFLSYYTPGTFFSFSSSLSPPSFGCRKWQALSMAVASIVFWYGVFVLPCWFFFSFPDYSYSSCSVRQSLFGSCRRFLLGILFYFEWKPLFFFLRVSGGPFFQCWAYFPRGVGMIGEGRRLQCRADLRLFFPSFPLFYHFLKPLTRH